MAVNGGDGGDKSNDLYSVLGLDKECSEAELRNAYKKLAMRWHPDRCSASGNSKFVEESKKKFQAIQQAYSVLSDANKRFLYDVGVYDSDDDDDENGMGDFLSEMAVMMSQAKSDDNTEESFEELQDLFEEMFQEGNGSFSLGSSSQGGSIIGSSSCSSSSTSYVSYNDNSTSNKRNSFKMNGNNKLESVPSFNSHFQSFCLGTGGTRSSGVRGEEGSKRRTSSQRNKR